MWKEEFQRRKSVRRRTQITVYRRLRWFICLFEHFSWGRTGTLGLCWVRFENLRARDGYNSKSGANLILKLEIKSWKSSRQYQRLVQSQGIVVWPKHQSILARRTQIRTERREIKMAMKFTNVSKRLDLERFLQGLLVGSQILSEALATLAMVRKWPLRPLKWLRYTDSSHWRGMGDTVAGIIGQIYFCLIFYWIWIMLKCRFLWW